jgi:hypothetical protein
MKKSDQPLQLLRPANQGWEIWKAPEDNLGSPPTLVPSPSEAPPGPVIFALPARKVLSEAFWIPAIEENLVRDSVWLQLEVRGLLPPNPTPEQVEISLLRSEGERTLVRADVYPSDLTLPTHLDPQHFIASPLIGQLPPNTLNLWLEDNAVVICLRLPEGPLLWESRSDCSSSSALSAGLETILLEWEAQELPCPVETIHDHTGLLPGPSWNSIPVFPQPKALPTLEWPAKFPTWVPPAVGLHRSKLQEKEKILHLLQLVGGTLGLILLVLVGYFTWQQTQLALLKNEAASLELVAQPLRETARTWEELSGSIDPSKFALERLLLAVKALPGQGVRLSLFEINSRGLRLEGDARNVGLANLYYNSLRAAEGAENLSWEMAPPALQPDNSAKFAIEATFPP